MALEFAKEFKYDRALLIIREISRLARTRNGIIDTWGRFSDAKVVLRVRSHANGSVATYDTEHQLITPVSEGNAPIYNMQAARGNSIMTRPTLSYKKAKRYIYDGTHSQLRSAVLTHATNTLSHAEVPMLFYFDVNQAFTRKPFDNELKVIIIETACLFCVGPHCNAITAPATARATAPTTAQCWPYA